MDIGTQHFVLDVKTDYASIASQARKQVVIALSTSLLQLTCRDMLITTTPNTKVDLRGLRSSICPIFVALVDDECIRYVQNSTPPEKHCAYCSRCLPAKVGMRFLNGSSRPAAWLPDVSGHLWHAWPLLRSPRCIESVLLLSQVERAPHAQRHQQPEIESSFLVPLQMVSVFFGQ